MQVITINATEAMSLNESRERYRRRFLERKGK